jgi:predicted nuclease with TOPRIM domain
MTLTKSDQTAIRNIVREETSGLVEGYSNIQNDAQSLKEDVADLKQKIDLLPTKEEFFSKMDKVVAELKTIREEQQALAHRSRDHEDRITTLETTTPQ